MFSKLSITLVLYVCLPVAINCSPAAIEKIAYLAEQKGGPLLIVSDFNGVLVNKVKGGAKITPQQMRPFLEEVAAPHINRGNTFYVASSKPATELQALLGSVEGLGLSAEHGMEIRPPDSQEFKLTTELSSQQSEAIFEKLERKLPPEFTKKDASHRFSRSYQYVEGFNILAFQKSLKKALPKNFEVVLDLEKNQIMVASKERGKHKVVEQLLSSKKFGFGISLGDKPADFGMHQAMLDNEFAGIIVGPRYASTAREMGLFHLEGPEEVKILLRRLLYIYQNRN